MSHPPDWCPTCRERTGLPEGGVCLWCSATLVHRGRGGKPKGKHRRISDTQLRALHVAYQRDRGLSINALAKAVHGRLGYKSHDSCARAIAEGWARLGLEVRDRVEQVRATCTIHGLAPRHGPRPGYQTVKRRAHQPDQPPCAGFKTQPPSIGRRCTRPAMFGSAFCHSHDPGRELERQAATARMRRRLPAGDMLPMAPFAAWLDGLAAQHGSLRAASTTLGLNYSAAARYAMGRGTNGATKPTVTAATAARWAALAGATIDDIYPSAPPVALGAVAA